MAQAKKKRRRNRNDPDRAVKAAQRDEARRRDREAKAAAAAAAERRANIRKRVKGLLMPALVGIAVIALGYLVFKPTPEVEGVQSPPEIEAAEVEPGAAPFDYGTPTPTSGPYSPGDPACGVFTEPVTLSDAVAALRVGSVVLWHQPDDEATATALSDLARGFESHVVVSPNPDIADKIVATAWNRLMAYDSPDGVDEFLDTYRNRGSENADCPVG